MTTAHRSRTGSTPLTRAQVAHAAVAVAVLLVVAGLIVWFVCAMEG